MARSTKSYERMLQLEKKEQESLRKQNSIRTETELKKRQKDVETKKRTHRLCQIGSVCGGIGAGSAIEEDDIPKADRLLKRQEANGRSFSQRQCRKSQRRIRRKCNAGGVDFFIPFIAFS